MSIDCHVYIFDVDGVLVYPWGEPRPLGFKALSWALADGAVYIVSGRPARERGLLTRLLRSISVKPGLIAGYYLRQDPGIGEVEHKLSSVQDILSTEGCILEVHDDNPRVLDSLRRLVTGGLILHYNDNCEAVYGSTRIPYCKQ